MNVQEKPLRFERRSKFLLAEWNSLRKESMDAIQHRVTIQRWGIAGATALVVFGLDLALERDHYRAAFWLLAVGGPAFACFIATLWAGEAKRSGRAGEYMMWIEKELNAAFAGDDSIEYPRKRSTPRPYPLLGWESFLRVRRGQGTNQMEWPYWVLGAGFLVSALVGPVVGAFIGAGHVDWSTSIAAACGFVATAYFVALLLWIARTIT
jgi:hypothetical protein